MKKIYKYTDYKKEAAVFIQQEFAKKTTMSINIEQFCMQCYQQYLHICNVVDDNIYNKLEKYFHNIGTYHIETEDELYNNGYNKEIADNINELLDKLTVSL